MDNNSEAGALSSTIPVKILPENCSSSSHLHAATKYVQCIDQGRKDLTAFNTYLDNLCAEFSLGSDGEVGIVVTTTATVALRDKITAETYSLDELEASVLQKHETLVSHGLVA